MNGKTVLALLGILGLLTGVTAAHAQAMPGAPDNGVHTMRIRDDPLIEIMPAPQNVQTFLVHDNLVPNGPGIAFHVAPGLVMVFDDPPFNTKISDLLRFRDGGALDPVCPITAAGVVQSCLDVVSDPNIAGPIEAAEIYLATRVIIAGLGGIAAEASATYILEDDDDVDVPEPSSFLLVAGGLLGIGAVAWRRRAYRLNVS